MNDSWHTACFRVHIGQHTFSRGLRVTVTQYFILLLQLIGPESRPPLAMVRSRDYGLPHTWNTCVFAKHRPLTCMKERFKGMPAKGVHVILIAL